MAISRFTALFEGIGIEWLKVASQKAVGDQLGLSWDEVHAIQERAVRRGLARRLGRNRRAHRRRREVVHPGPSLFHPGQRPGSRAVLFVAENREQSSLDAFWSGLSEAQLEAVRAVAMDMRDPYVNSTCRYLPDAERKIVFDKFHIAKYLF
jgi:transposase